MIDNHEGYSTPLPPTATESFVITSDDDNNLTQCPLSIHCNTSGNLVCYLKDDVINGDSTPRTFGLTAGLCYGYRVKRMMEASTAEIVGVS
ncbi:MAG: hypothetical protein ACJ8C4_05660 [Gemmataceae bacterium]